MPYIDTSSNIYIVDKCHGDEGFQPLSNQSPTTLEQMERNQSQSIGNRNSSFSFNTVNCQRLIIDVIKNLFKTLLSHWM